MVADSSLDDAARTSPGGSRPGRRGRLDRSAAAAVRQQPRLDDALQGQICNASLPDGREGVAALLKRRPRFGRRPSRGLAPPSRRTHIAYWLFGGSISPDGLLDLRWSRAGTANVCSSLARTRDYVAIVRMALALGRVRGRDA